MSIDNLPTEMPLEASQYFSDALFPIISDLSRGNFSSPIIKRATIVDSGELVPRFDNLKTAVEVHGKQIQLRSSKPKKILLIGSGFVAKPLVDYLLKDTNYSVTIASNDEIEARDLSQNRKNAPVVSLNVQNDTEYLGVLVKMHDIVVSFVPAAFHVLVAEQCLKFKKNLVTASYISPSMKALDQEAKKAGLIFMNEIGLDPGIDHLTACQIFDDVKDKGGKITSFISWCGGLPAPEYSNNPLGYKFSWRFIEFLNYILARAESYKLVLILRFSKKMAKLSKSLEILY